MYDQQIKSFIAQHFPEATVDVSGSEGKYQAVVVSPQFAGLSTVERHQLVYKAVHEEIKSGALHALTIVAKTPEEVTGCD